MVARERLRRHPTRGSLPKEVFDGRHAIEVAHRGRGYPAYGRSFDVTTFLWWFSRPSLLAALRLFERHFKNIACGTFLSD